MPNLKEIKFAKTNLREKDALPVVILFFGFEKMENSSGSRSNQEDESTESVDNGETDSTKVYQIRPKLDEK